jgi:hypothetical protein
MAEPATTTQPKSSITQQIIDRFPAFATILQVPEIADLVEKASTGNWSQAYFQEQLWSTPWWKQTPENERTWQALKLVDPAEAGAQAKQMAANVIGTATSLGINLTPAQVSWYSEWASQGKWDQPTLTRSLVDSTAQKQIHAGTINSTRDSLHATAADYGLAISDQNAMRWAEQIATGRQTTDGFADWARNQAKASFPALQKEIDGGLTVKQLADPYFQLAGQTLGVDPDTLSLSDPRWSVALQSRDAKGNIVGPMNTLDWVRKLQTDDAYGYAKTAQGQLAGHQLADDIATTFGKSTLGSSLG